MELVHCVSRYTSYVLVLHILHEAIDSSGGKIRDLALPRNLIITHIGGILHMQIAPMFSSSLTADLMLNRLVKDLHGLLEDESTRIMIF